MSGITNYKSDLFFQTLPSLMVLTTLKQDCLRWAAFPLLFAIMITVACQQPVHASNSKWSTIGLRAGVGDTRNSASITKVETFLNYSLSPTWELDSNWIIGIFLGVNVGMLHATKNAFLCSAGPGLYLYSPGKRLAVFTGSFATYLSRYKLDSEDFGSSFQFISAAGANYVVLKFVSFRYSYQHISNAGLYSQTLVLIHT